MKHGSHCKTLTETAECLYCQDTSLSVLRPRFRVGTTAGLKDEPISGALKRRAYAEMGACALDWVVCPSDHAAITAMLNGGLIDMVMAPVEDALLLAHNSKTLKVCGSFDGPRRMWRLFTRPNLQGGTKLSSLSRLGVPDSLCASLITCLMQDWGYFGWDQRPPEIVVISSFVEALHLICGVKSIQGLLWECWADELKAARCACMEAVAPVQTPWSSHLFVCSRESLHSKSHTIRQFYNFTNDMLQEETFAPELSARLKVQYSLAQADVDAWLGEKDWRCYPDIHYHDITRPSDFLARLGLLVDRPTMPSTEALRCVASCSRVVGGAAPEPRRQQQPLSVSSATPTPAAPSSPKSQQPGGDADDLDEGMKVKPMVAQGELISVSRLWRGHMCQEPSSSAQGGGHPGVAKQAQILAPAPRGGLLSSAAPAPVPAG